MKKLIEKLDKNVKIVKYEYEDDKVIIELESKKKSVNCPYCGKSCSNIHSHYTKDIKDLPIQEYKTILRLDTRVFFCKNKKCKHTRFAERFDFYENYSRMTNRLKERIVNDSKGMSARASKATINDGLVDVSDDTILRLIKKKIIIGYKKPEEIERICIDDFALRKRYKYGTVMVDADTHDIVDILESRIAEDVAEWLKKYPNIKMISRDGGTMYKSASSIAHPNAIQLSDRFHVLKSLTESILNIVTRELNKVIVFGENKEKYNEALKQLNLAVARTKSARERQNEKREAKIELIEKAKQIYLENPNYEEIARQLQISSATASKYVKCETTEDCLYKASQRNNRLTKPYEETIKSLDKKGYGRRKIYKIIKKAGYTGCESNVKDYLNRLHRENKIIGNVEEKLERSYVIKAIFKGIDDVIKTAKEKEGKDIENMFKKLLKEYPLIGKIFKLLKQFKKIMFIDKKPEKLDAWIEETKKLKDSALDEFINGITNDLEAVKNGIKYELSNGLAEGSVNKIKVIKRIMYGRCSFGLLRQKVLLI